MLEVRGYKGFTENMENEPGDKFEVGKIYTTTNKKDLLFGMNGNGFHFCKSLEDCFIYFKPETSVYAEVTGLEEVRETNDEFNDIYGICVARKIRIDKILTPDEIIEMYINQPRGICTMALKRFIQLYHPLTDEQISMLEKMYMRDNYILKDIMYYQRKIEDTYSNSEKSLEYQKQLIKKYESSSE